MQQQLSLDEIAALIGQQRIEILLLQKQLAAAQARIAELEKPKEAE